MFARIGIVAWAGWCCVALAQANDPKTIMTQRGKLLLQDDFSSSIDKDWKKAKGKFEVTGGSLRVAELKEDMHGAVMRYKLPVGASLVFQYDFKLDGAKSTTLSLNATKGHLCRVSITPTSFNLRKDSTDKNVTDKAAVLDQRKFESKTGTWHTLVAELQGKEMLATIDGENLIYGKHDKIDQLKANFGLTVAGESVSFKNLRVWEGQPNPTWETERQKVIDSRKK